MRKKKIEKLIFNILMLLPLILFLGWYLMAILKNHHGNFDINALNTYQTLLSYISLDSMSGFIVEPVLYFLDLFNVATDIGYVLAMYIQYIVTIELLWLLYDVIIFVPRACRSIVEKGM